MKTVIEMAIEADLIYNEEGCCKWVEDTDLRPFIERFAELVRADAIADEREACAKVLDEMAEDMEREIEPSTAIAYVRSKAAAIRARGQA